MINIASTPSLGWPSSPAPAVAPVVAASAVTPVQGSARESRAGLGFGQGGQPAQAPKAGQTEPGTEASAPAAAPLLPRSHGESADGPVDASEQIEADKRQAEEQAQELAKEQAVQQQLREVLSNVWQASAAVVEQALASSDTAAAAAAVTEAGDPVPGVAAVPESTGSAPAMSAGGAPEPIRGGEPEAYDERGNSSWTLPEVGSLVDQRV